MLILDQTLIGRKYTSTNGPQPSTTFTIRGGYVKPDSGLIIIGEFANDPNDIQSKTTLKTHRIVDIELLP